MTRYMVLTKISYIRNHWDRTTATIHYLRSELSLSFIKMFACNITSQASVHTKVCRQNLFRSFETFDTSPYNT